MITLGLLSLLLVAATVGGFLVLARVSSLETALARVCWVPIAALLAQALFARQLAARLSYLVVALPVLTCIVSLVLGLIGATLVAAARQRGEPTARALRATLVASIPAALLAAYVLYAFLAAL